MQCIIVHYSGMQCTIVYYSALQWHYILNDILLQSSANGQRLLRFTNDYCTVLLEKPLGTSLVQVVDEFLTANLLILSFQHSLQCCSQLTIVYQSVLHSTIVHYIVDYILHFSPLYILNDILLQSSSNGQRLLRFSNDYCTSRKTLGNVSGSGR